MSRILNPFENPSTRNGVRPSTVCLPLAATPPACGSSRRHTRTEPLWVRGQLIQHFLDNSEAGIQAIWTSDAEIVDFVATTRHRGVVRPLGGHDKHFHVRFE